MDKRAISIGSIILGLAAIVLSALRFINGAGDLQNLTEILIYSITGSVALFYGIHQLYELKNHHHVSKPLSTQKQHSITNQ